METETTWSWFPNEKKAIVQQKEINPINPKEEDYESHIQDSEKEH